MKQVLLLLLCLISNLALAQGSLNGYVFDSKTAKPLEGANIQITETKFHAVTNSKGQFKISDIPLGEYKIQVSFMGFENHVQEVKISKSGKNHFEFAMKPGILQKEEFVVTATRNQNKIEDVPGSIQVISRKQIEELPSQKIDDLIQYACGLNVIRSGGAWTMRPVVSLRGLSGDEQGRTLVMIDGVPVNKGDTGGVNWNRIDKNSIQQIEIFRGPGSSLYGNNAMGGVINIITKTPGEKLQGKAGISFGTYNTQQSNIYLGSKINQKLWLTTSAFFTSSDGYNAIPDSLRSNPDYSIPRFLEEKGISAKAGYNYSKAFNLDFQYDYFEDKRGEGEKIEVPRGEYRHFDTRFFKARAKGSLSIFNYELNVFIQKEDYFKLDERIKNGIYSRFDVNSDRIDQGVMAHFNKKTGSHQNLSWGFDIKQSSVEGGDYYQTSNDSTVNSGKMNFMAFYLQDELSFFANRIKVIAGLRFDQARFFEGSYLSTNNSWALAITSLESNTWTSISPRLSAAYKLGSKSKVYLSYARGFRASILDDLCRSGWMWIGPKIANSKLGPEKIDNYEIGASIAINQSFRISPAVFFSQGDNFLYYVATGDSLGMRPIYQRQNITEVEIFGAELEAEYQINNQLTVFVFYTFNQSEILSFKKNPELKGKRLTYSPKNQIKSTITWASKSWNAAASLMYKDQQFADDKNTIGIDPYFSANLKIARNFDQHMQAYVSIQNIFDEQHLDNALYLSPGRLVTLGLNFKF
jgi:iron complex outermembrane recepter protein